MDKKVFAVTYIEGKMPKMCCYKDIKTAYISDVNEHDALVKFFDHVNVDEYLECHEITIID